MQKVFKTLQSGAPVMRALRCWDLNISNWKVISTEDIRLNLTVKRMFPYYACKLNVELYSYKLLRIPYPF